jgi:hypothetical protein
MFFDYVTCLEILCTLLLELFLFSVYNDDRTISSHCFVIKVLVQLKSLREQFEEEILSKMQVFHYGQNFREGQKVSKSCHKQKVQEYIFKCMLLNEKNDRSCVVSGKSYHIFIFSRHKQLGNNTSNPGTKKNILIFYIVVHGRFACDKFLFLKFSHQGKNNLFERNFSSNCCRNFIRNLIIMRCLREV